jgi:hypothetical protein
MRPVKQTKKQQAQELKPGWKLVLKRAPRQHRTTRRSHSTNEDRFTSNPQDGDNYQAGSGTI